MPSDNLQNIVIVPPPPFTNGKLHLGHYYQYSIIDSYIKLLKNLGFNSELILGFDVHGIAISNKIKQITHKYPIFEKYALTDLFIENNIRLMLAQFDNLKIRPKQIWSTHDYSHRLKVSQFIKKANAKGLIKYDYYLQEYCPSCKEFIVHSECSAKNYTVKSYIVNWTVNDQIYQTMTTQPELLRYAKAIFYNPQDNRYVNLQNQFATIDKLGLKIPIYASKKVALDLGTGLVFCATYGSHFDYELLSEFNITAPSFIDARTNTVNNLPYFEYKNAEIKMLLDSTIITYEKEIPVIRIVHTERSSCNNQILLVKSLQLYLESSKLKNELLIMANSMQIFPKKHMAQLLYWIENIKDWCISRKYPFGTHCWLSENLTSVEPDISFSEIPLQYRYDCWIDSSISWLTTQYISHTQSCQIQFQGYEIIRTWLLYSMIAAVVLDYPYPFEKVVILPLILGKNNKKLSKSNPEHIAIQNIVQTYDTRIIRLWALLRNPSADSQYQEKDFQFCKKFLIKLENIKKYIDYNKSLAVKSTTDVSQKLKELEHNYEDLLSLIRDTKQKMLNFEFDSFKDILEFTIDQLSNTIIVNNYTFSKNIQTIQIIEKMHIEIIKFVEVLTYSF